MTGRVLWTLGALEARRSVGPVIDGLACLAGIPILPLLLHGDRDRLASWLPGLTLGVVIPLVAAALGGDALAGERAARTWGFLRARPVSHAGLLGVKLAVRAAAMLAFGLAAWAVAVAWIGREPAAGEMLGASPTVGLWLCAALSVMSLGFAFAAGARLPEPLVAALAGFLLAQIIVGLALISGPLAHAPWLWAVTGNAGIAR